MEKKMKNRNVVLAEIKGIIFLFIVLVFLSFFFSIILFANFTCHLRGNFTVYPFFFFFSIYSIDEKKINPSGVLSMIKFVENLEFNKVI